MVAFTGYVRAAPNWEGEGQQPLLAWGTHHAIGVVSQESPPLQARTQVLPAEQLWLRGGGCNPAAAVARCAAQGPAFLALVAYVV